MPKPARHHNLIFLILALSTFFPFHKSFFAYGQSSTSATGTSISDSTLQKMGCVNSAGQEFHNGCKLIAAIDLTKQFPIRVKLEFAITQGPSANTKPGAGELSFCFVQDDESNCGYNIAVDFPRIGRVAPVPNYPLNMLLTAKLIYPNKGALFPIIFVQAKDDIGGRTSGLIYTIIWAYHPENKKFVQIWFNASNLNLNEETRLFTDGPLAGNLVVAATGLDSEPYEIIIYNLNPLVGFSETVGLYASREKYAPGSKGPGIDLNMTELLVLLEQSEEPQGIEVSSSRTGDYEGGWLLMYGILKYYGFDDAADLLTKATVQKVHSCPFSTADKADFDSWIVEAKFQMQAVLKYGANGVTIPSKRPDLPDGEPSRKETAIAAEQIVKQDYRKMFAVLVWLWRP